MYIYILSYFHVNFKMSGKEVWIRLSHVFRDQWIDGSREKAHENNGSGESENKRIIPSLAPLITAVMPGN